MEGDYTLYVYRIGNESLNNRFRCLVDIESNSSKLHPIKSYPNLSYDQKEKVKRIVGTFRGNESNLLKKLSRLVQSQA